MEQEVLEDSACASASCPEATCAAQTCHARPVEARSETHKTVAVAEEARKTDFDFDMMSRNIPQPRVQQCILDQYVDDLSRVMLFTSSEWRQICVLADRFLDFASRAIYIVDEVTADMLTAPSAAQRALTQDDDAEGLAPPSTPPWPACVDGLW